MAVSTYIAIAIAAAIGALLIAKFSWHVVPPDQVLVISGAGVRTHAQVFGFRVVTSGGALVVPAFQQVRTFSLAEHRFPFAFECTTHSDARLRVHGMVIFKVGDDSCSIENAVRRYLDQANEMDGDVHAVLEGHLRAIVGNMTLEGIRRDREDFTHLIRESMGVEMEKLGLIIDSLQFHAIDESGAGS